MGFGIREKMNKLLIPDATTADLGEGMQAYYDEKLKVWVFPGKDPDEVPTPIGRPPTTALTEKEESPKAESSTPQDPLAAMMAPPQCAQSLCVSCHPLGSQFFVLAHFDLFLVRL